MSRDQRPKRQPPLHKLPRPQQPLFCCKGQLLRLLLAKLRLSPLPWWCCQKVKHFQKLKQLGCLLLCCYVGHGNQMSKMTVTQKLFWGHNNTLEAFFKGLRKKQWRNDFTSCCGLALATADSIHHQPESRFVFITNNTQKDVKQTYEVKKMITSVFPCWSNLII